MSRPVPQQTIYQFGKQFLILLASLNLSLMQGLGAVAEPGLLEVANNK